MDPTTVRGWQAIPYAVSSIAFALLFGLGGALAVIVPVVIGALTWTGLAVRYRHRRLDGISGRRARGDRVMDQNGVIAFLPGIIACVVGIIVAPSAALQPAPTAALLDVPLLVIVISSSIDWYVVRSFVDGVEGPGACRLDLVPLARRRRYTKLWVAHRLLCESLIAVALLVSAGLLINHYAHGLKAAVTVLSVLGVSGIAVALAWQRWIVGGLRFCLRQSPALGNWVRGPVTAKTGARVQHGFVRDVSLDNGLKIVRSPTAREYFIVLVDAAPDISESPKGYYGCTDDECKCWLKNQDEITCDRYWREQEGTSAQTSPARSSATASSPGALDSN